MTRKRFSATALTKRLLEFDGKCAECSGKFGGSHGKPEWDHIIPLELGGDDAIENLQPLHKGCHKAKTKEDVGHIAKSKRMQQRASGIDRQPKAVIPGSTASGWKHKMNGDWVKR